MESLEDRAGNGNLQGKSDLKHGLSLYGMAQVGYNILKEKSSIILGGEGKFLAMTASSGAFIVSGTYLGIYLADKFY